MTHLRKITFISGLALLLIALGFHGEAMTATSEHGATEYMDDHPYRLKYTIYSQLLRTACTTPKEIEYLAATQSQAYLLRSLLVREAINENDVTADSIELARLAERLYKEVAQIDPDYGYVHPSFFSLADVSGPWSSTLDPGVQDRVQVIGLAVGMYTQANPPERHVVDQKEYIQDLLSKSNGYNTNEFVQAPVIVPSLFVDSEHDALLRVGEAVQALSDHINISDAKLSELKEAFAKD